MIKFRDLCIGNVRLFLALNSWFLMPNTVQKVHGTEIMSDSSLPMDMMSGEVQEAHKKNRTANRDNSTVER